LDYVKLFPQNIYLTKIFLSQRYLIAIFLEIETQKLVPAKAGKGTFRAFKGLYVIPAPAGIRSLFCHLYPGEDQKINLY